MSNRNRSCRCPRRAEEEKAVAAEQGKPPVKCCIDRVSAPDPPANQPTQKNYHWPPLSHCQSHAFYVIWGILVLITCQPILHACIRSHLAHVLYMIWSNLFKNNQSDLILHMCMIGSNIISRWKRTRKKQPSASDIIF